jgi:uncharacterized protein (TIGR02391 family)
VLERLGEAYDWLVYHGLVATDPEKHGEWAYVTERGRRARFEGDAALKRIRAEARLDVDLHPSLAMKVRRQYLLGDWEIAAFAAFKEVEVRVRALAGVGPAEIGVPLMRQAFSAKSGALTDPAVDAGEQVATMELFAGAVGLFKNPISHRPVNYDDATEAAEIILLADLLMRLLDRVEDSLNSAAGGSVGTPAAGSALPGP